MVINIRQRSIAVKREIISKQRREAFLWG